MAIVRVNQNVFQCGEEWNNRLLSETTREFTIYLSLLSSYWTSTIQGPNYTIEIQAMSRALAQIRLMLSDIQNDFYFSATRGEFLYQTLTALLFPTIGSIQSLGAPTIDQSDIEFRTFLQQIVAIYFKGSVLESVQQAVELVTGGTVIVWENYLLARTPGSGYDISDEFGISIDVLVPTPGVTGPGLIDPFLSDFNIQLLLRIIRPAHTLYTLKYILQDSYIGQQQPIGPNGVSPQPNKVLDVPTVALSNYGYEDFRKFTNGVARIDTLGSKVAQAVQGEDHTGQF